MTTRLAISGFGRIGRMVLRAPAESGRDDAQIVLINTPGPVEASAHLYQFDSVHGRARAAAMSMIPTYTGAARSVADALPQLQS